jgi:hypothetical protein
MKAKKEEAAPFMTPAKPYGKNPANVQFRGSAKQKPATGDNISFFNFEIPTRNLSILTAELTY